MEAPLISPSFRELDGRAIAGWAALEQGNIEEARAALQDVYSVDPAHPALPLLAAGIRRARPKQIPWRGIVLFACLLAVGTLAWHASRSSRLGAESRSAAGDVALAQQDTPVAAISSPSASPIGTAGRVEPAPTSPRFEPARVAPNDDAQIRQAITRFASAYSSRWTPLTFRSCDITRSEDTASVACQSHATQGSTESPDEGTWEFACRRVGESWKIVRMQPPADTPAR